MKAVETTSAYFDTGALLKVYHTEAGSEQASSIALRHAALPLSFVLEIELKNALRALCRRGNIQQQQLEKMLDCIDYDIAEGRLYKLRSDAKKIETTAFDLSERFTTHLLSRSLDILHVAIALCAEIPNFVTGDKRQAKLAAAAGLEVEFINIPPSK
ncbi:MAG: putative nucleic acid-binding protein [Candidatus Azotimanducaceae bacterium]|jgi:predicted nucleic acid-binding protein